MSDRFLPGCDGPRPKCETCADRGLIYDDGALVPCPCREREVWAWSDRTGWLTQMPLSEAICKGYDWGDTNEELREMMRETLRRKHAN